MPMKTPITLSVLVASLKSLGPQSLVALGLLCGSCAIAAGLGLPLPGAEAIANSAPEAPANPRTPTAMTPDPAVSATIDPRLVTAQNQFGFELLRQLQDSASENRVISPLSVAIALAMAQNGAGSTTLSAMQQTLHLDQWDEAAINGAIAAQIDALGAADPSVQMAIANSLWARQNSLELQPDFMTAARQAYGAEVQTLDFDQPAALQTINGWVARATADKIPTILDQINSDDVLFLINAIYFKGLWQTPFEPAETAEAPFYLADGSTLSQPLMHQSGDFLYAETDTFQAVTLPYGNGRFTMTVLLPKTAAARQSLQSGQLNDETWQQWQRLYRQRPGTLKLPRFKIEAEADLNSALSNLGMAIAFNPGQADFSRLSSHDTFISRVKHKTLIEVNEAGTEAAGVTAIGIRTTSAPSQPPQPFEMTVDQPFFIAIQENTSRSILFLGWVMDPSSL